MEISESMINFYLMNVTTGGKNPDEFSPDDVENVSEYHPLIEQMKMHAIWHGDLDALKLGLEYILANPHYDCLWLAGPVYTYDEEQLREIIHYAWKTIWPDADPITPESTKDTKLVATTLDEWWESREHKPGQKKVEAEELFNNKLRGNLLG